MTLLEWRLSPRPMTPLSLSEQVLRGAAGGAEGPSRAGEDPAAAPTRPFAIRTNISAMALVLGRVG